VRLVEQQPDRPLEQRLLELDHLPRGLERLGPGRRRRPPGDLLERVVEIDPVRLLRDLADQREVRHDELGGRLGPRVACQEPGEEAVVELAVGREVDAADGGAAEDVDQPLPGLCSVVPGGEQQRHVRVVGAGEPVAHEEPRVGVLDGDALVVADLTGDGIGPRHDDTARRGGERTVRGVQPRLDGGALAADPGGLRKPALVARDERHGLDQRVHLEAVRRIVGVGEAQRVAQLRDAVLHLDPRVHLHEVVPLAIDDALERGRRVELDGGAEAFRFGLHALEHAEIALERRRLRALPCGLRLGDGVAQALLGDRDLHQLLLVHLQRAVAPAERDAPVAIAENLDLVVPCLLDVQLEQHVLVVSDAGRLHLREDLADEPGHDGGVGEDALPLAAAAPDGLQAEAAPRLLGEEALRLEPERLAELVDREEIDPFPIRRLEHLLGQRRQGSRRVTQPDHVEPVLLRHAGEGDVVRVLAQQRPHRGIVEAGGHRDLVLDGRPLGLVFRAGRQLRVRAWPDEGDPGVLERTHEAGVLRHEAVAGEHVVVPMLLADANDLPHPLVALFPGGPRVVGHGVHVARVHDAHLG
jgi:hypothetical protein